MEKLREQVKALFAVYHFPAHDYKHVYRVSKLARQIAEAEGYDAQEAEIAGLLHDVGRTVKDSNLSHAHAGVPIAKDLLDNFTDLSQEVKDRIVKSVEVHSDPTTEGKLNNIVQDADKLDGMGAIGVNRAYVSQQGKPDFYEDAIYPPAGDYYNIKTVHELLALILEWYGMLYTDKAREIGKPRHEFMKSFMERIKEEVEESV